MVTIRDLSSPGGASYSSDTMHVGDGTWDSARDTFLMPNLMGVNFDTMRYNGMGNRFRGDHYYKHLIVAHGIFAAITFLILMPAGIFTARFFHRDPYWSRRIHVGLQLLCLFTLTTVFVLGWYAVGNKRKLTNPHHGIGLAIYVMFWAQFLWGWFLHFRKKHHTELKNLFIIFIHRWLGRAVLLLGMAQIPLGLCLYGSPLALFIIYAIVMAILILLYFIFNYRNERRSILHYDAPVATVISAADDGRYRHRHGGHERIGELEPASDISRDEKRRSRSRRRTAAGGGLFSRVLRGGRRPSQPATYAPAPVHERPTEYAYGDAAPARVEEGRAHSPMSESDAESRHGRRRRRLSRRRHGRVDSTAAQERHHEHEIEAAEAVVAAGALGALGRFMKSRREKKEERRVEEIRRHEVEEERLMRETTLMRQESRERERHSESRSPRRRSQHRAKPSASSVSGTTDPDTEATTEPGRSELTTHSGTDFTSESSVVVPALRPKKRQSKTAPAEAHAKPETSKARRRDSIRHEDETDDSGSPADLSLHMRTNDGDDRSVTLRRLTPDEVAAARRSKSDRKRRDSRGRATTSDTQQRRPSRSGSRPATQERRRSVSRPAPAAPQTLGTISEVSTKSASHSTSTKSTGWLQMEARERYEQELMDRESKLKGKQPSHAPDTAVSGNQAPYAPPPATPYDGPPYPSGQQGPGQTAAIPSPGDVMNPVEQQPYALPTYTYIPENYSQAVGDYPTSSYLPQQSTRSYGQQPYGSLDNASPPEQQPFARPETQTNVTFADQVPPRGDSRQGVQPTMPGGESDGEDVYASRREKRRSQRRSGDRPASRVRGEDVWN
ncbi:hypothetical protein KEM52_006355 [Ascosphaera acerosa]|nr:hypothetical protein KEM52_006355 [Ascosphaera acerosa]